MRFALLALALTAGKTDPSLVGTWLLGGQPFMTLNANGTGVMEDGKLKWSVEGKTLVIADDEDGTDRATYALAGDTLTLTLGGVPLSLTRAGKGVAVQKAGRLSKAANKQSEAEADAEALAEAQRYLAQQQQGQRGAQPQQPGPPQRGAPARGGAGNDQLSQLLTSSAWCYLRFANGNTSTERIVFSRDGTWSNNKESEIYGRNDYAGTSAHSVGNSGGGGQWTVKGGQLYFGEGGGELQPVALQITRNSNGYPIITADGREYSQCN